MQRSSKIFIRNLRVNAFLGVHAHECDECQPVRIDLELDLGALNTPQHDRLEETVDYEAIANKAEALVKADHTQLVETLAERIAMMCLAHDSRIRAVMVRLEKPHALNSADAAGAELIMACDGHTARF